MAHHVYILSKARNHMIRFFCVHCCFHTESFNKTFQMLNFKWSSNFLFVGIAIGSCQFLLPSIFYYIHIFSRNIFLLLLLCFQFFPSFSLLSRFSFYIFNIHFDAFHQLKDIGEIFFLDYYFCKEDKK